MSRTYISNVLTFLVEGELPPPTCGSLQQCSKSFDRIYLTCLTAIRVLSPQVLANGVVCKILAQYIEEFTALRRTPPAAASTLECPEFEFLWHYSRYPRRGHLINKGIE
jgi:hypothetical protein